MNISQIQSFVALAETGSFTEAAEQLYLSQSAISHALAALERELGVTLIERNRKGVIALSEAGERILPHARAFLSQVSAIEQEAKASQGSYSGKLRLGSIHSFVAPNRLASLLSHFQAHYPEIEVTLFEGAIHEIGEWIDGNLIDLSFMILPAPEFTTRPIFHDELFVVLPEEHPLQEQDKLRLDDLLDQALVIERGHCTLRLMEQLGIINSSKKPKIRYKAHDSATILAMVREGLGLTFIPKSMLPKQADGLIVRAIEPRFPLQIGLGVKSWQQASPNVRLFIEAAQQWANQTALQY